ncbi:MAG: TIGR00730 family Rossman fold protein [Bacteroidetes bacterium]|nr:TIGR00730 family Rossman fold protein [Bacteroidota bacterium]MBS1649724.1 TIGR00730 family Rossman fold protein [Bacteroidota bacterium]
MYSSITVFCGSKTGNNPLFIQQATELGCLLAKHSITLVYGGGKVGIMGALANACMNNGGKVIGVIPELLIEWEQQHTGITELKVVADMHIRKKFLYELGDAAIVLPGGNGTLDELYEMITWNTLKIHEKKIYILNTANYYNNLLAHFDTMQTEGFLYDNWRDKITIINEPKELFIK